MLLGRFNFYVLSEILKIFIVALVITTTMITLGTVVKELVTEQLGWLAILQLLPYGLPIALQFAVPATLLFAVCAVYGRISADNEVVAVKAAGVSPIRIVTPTLVLALLVSPAAVWMNDLAVSWGRPGITSVIMHSVEEIVYNNLRTQLSYSTQKGFSIHVQGVQGKKLIRPTIMLHPTDGEATTISAAIGELRLDPVLEKLVIEMRDVEWEKGEVTGTLPGVWREEIPLDLAAKKGESNSKSPSQYALRDIPAQVVAQKQEIETHRELLAAHVGLGLLTGRFDQLEDQRTQQHQWHEQDGIRRLHRLQLEPWRRWSGGFSCFFFVWLGIPVAISMRSADYWTTFGVCFLPILLLYYPVFMLGLDRAKNGAWPAYSVWLGNLLLLIVGAWMLRRVNRS